MPSGNLDEPVTTTSDHAEPPRTFRLPAHYYSTPPAGTRPLFPKWVPMGCGTASAILIVLLFAGGALLTGPRLAWMLDFIVGSSLGDFKGMYAKDVTADQKTRFDEEVKRMREALRSDKISAQNMQPFLKSMSAAIGDKSVTPAEVEQLTKTAHEATVIGKKKIPPVEGPPARDHRPLAH